MNVIYYDLYQSKRLESFVSGLYTGDLTPGSLEIIAFYRKRHLIIPSLVENLLSYELNTDCFLVAAYGEFLKSQGEAPVHWRRASSPEEVLKEADVV